MKPDFIIIGAMKAGTTTLWKYLQSHPAIFMSNLKEPNYFVEEKTWSRGWKWYASLFDEGHRLGAKVVGEASTNYSKVPEFTGVSQRIASCLPEVKLIYLVRDPIERIRSMYVHRVYRGYEPRPFEDAVLSTPQSSYVEFSRYFRQLGEYLNYFRKDRILVIASEDLWEYPSTVLPTVAQFLGVDGAMFNVGQQIHANQSSNLRYRNAVGRLVSRSTAITLGLERVLGRASPLLTLVTTKSIEKPQVSSSVRDELHALLKLDAKELRLWCGKRFPQWTV